MGRDLTDIIFDRNSEKDNASSELSYYYKNIDNIIENSLKETLCTLYSISELRPDTIIESNNLIENTNIDTNTLYQYVKENITPVLEFYDINQFSKENMIALDPKMYEIIQIQVIENYSAADSNFSNLINEIHNIEYKNIMNKNNIGLEESYIISKNANDILKTYKNDSIYQSVYETSSIIENYNLIAKTLNLPLATECFKNGDTLSKLENIVMENGGPLPIGGTSATALVSLMIFENNYANSPTNNKLNRETSKTGKKLARSFIKSEMENCKTESCSIDMRNLYDIWR